MLKERCLVNWLLARPYNSSTNKASFTQVSQSQQIGRSVVVSDQQPATTYPNDNISRRKKIKTNPVQLNFEFPKTPKNTAQMSDLLAESFCD